MRVQVQHGNVEKALRKLKKKVNEDGRIQECRDRQEYTKPTTRRKKAKAAAKARWRKEVSKTSQPKRLY